MNPTLEIRILLEESRPGIIAAIREAHDARDSETLNALRDIRERLDATIDRLHARIVAENVTAEDIREEMAIARYESDRQGWH